MKSVENVGTKIVLTLCVFMFSHLESARKVGNNLNFFAYLLIEKLLLFCFFFFNFNADVEFLNLKKKLINIFLV